MFRFILTIGPISYCTQSELWRSPHGHDCQQSHTRGLWETWPCTQSQTCPDRRLRWETRSLFLTHLTQYCFTFNCPIFSVYSTDLKPRRVHAVHTSEVEVIAKGQNKVSSHLLCYMTHLPSSSLLHSGDVGRIGHTTPVSHSQELNWGSVFCEGTKNKTLKKPTATHPSDITNKKSWKSCVSYTYYQLPPSSRRQ